MTFKNIMGASLLVLAGSMNSLASDALVSDQPANQTRKQLEGQLQKLQTPQPNKTLKEKIERTKKLHETTSRLDLIEAEKDYKEAKKQAKRDYKKAEDQIKQRENVGSKLVLPYFRGQVPATNAAGAVAIPGESKAKLTRNLVQIKNKLAPEHAEKLSLEELQTQIRLQEKEILSANPSDQKRLKTYVRTLKNIEAKRAANANPSGTDTTPSTPRDATLSTLTDEQVKALGWTRDGANFKTAGGKNVLAKNVTVHGNEISVKVTNKEGVISHIKPAHVDERSVTADK